MGSAGRAGLVLGVALCLGLAACGGDDETAAPETPADGSPAGAATEPTPEETTGDADGDQQTIPAGPSVPVKVTYQTSGQGAGDLETMTLAWDPPRFAMIFAEGRLIQDGRETVFCGPPGEDCFRAPTDQSGQVGFMGAAGAFLNITAALEEAEAGGLPGATVTADTEIAGRAATCATFDAGALDGAYQGEAEYCYDQETAVLLRWSATDERGQVQALEAVEITTPEPSDFEPTGTVRDMPGGGGG